MLQKRRNSSAIRSACLKTQTLLSFSAKIGASSSSDFTEMWLELVDIMNLLKASSRHMADVVSTKVVVAD